MTDATYTATAPANSSAPANTSTPTSIPTFTSIPTSISVPVPTSTPTPANMKFNQPTEAATAVPQSRLLDVDTNKYRSLKQVIVIGRPGSGVDGVSDALKKLDYKVYDLQTASNRHERDFPLWLEAARLRQEGRPYNKSDFDKVIGNHDAIVGAPACFFDQDFVSLYPGVKIVLVTRDANVKIVDKFLQKIFSPFWRQFDPAYFGHIYEFLTLLAKSDDELCQNSEQFISDTVGEKNLLKIHNGIAWAPLCEFLGVRVPGAAEPELNDATTEALLAARPFRAAFEKVRQTAHSTTVWATNILKMVTIASASVLAVFVGTVLLLKLFLLLNVLVRRSLVRDVTRLFTAVVALGGLLCGFIAGYSLAVVRNPPAVTVASPTSTTSASPTVDSPRREYQRKNKWGRRKGRQDRDSQTANKQSIRPERTVLSAWTGAQDNIHQDDARVREQARATHTELSNGTPATFNVTHKQTEAQGVLSDRPRKVLAVTKETI